MHSYKEQEVIQLINLIKNEFIKIFNKKSTYIMFAFIFIFVVITNIIYKKELDESGNYKVNYYDSEYLEFAKEELKNNKEDKEYELSLRKDIMRYELIEKYGSESWQTYIIENNMFHIIEGIVNYKYKEENAELLKMYEEKYNLYIEKFDNNDYKYFVNLEIEDVNKRKEELKNNTIYPSGLKEDMSIEYDLELEVLNYRLKNNVDYSNTYLNRALNDYLNYAKIVKTRTIEEVIKENELHKEDSFLYQYYNELRMMKVNEYILDKKIDANKINDTRGILINLFNEYEIYILFAIIMFSAGIVSSEYSKGTIKQLLLTPYTRIQVLISKYITCILMSLFTIFITVIMQVLVGLFVFGISTMSIPVLVYNFNNSVVETYNVFHYLLIVILSKMPMIILIISIVLLISVITLNNALSTVFGIILYIATPIVSSIAIYSKIYFLNLLILPHWDFSKYLFGMISENNNINLKMSIILVIIYLIVSIIPSFIIFNRKDIKNI